MSCIETSDTNVETEVASAEKPQKLSLRRQMALIKSAFSITRGGSRWAVVFVFVTSMLRAGAAVFYDWHWKFLTDSMIEFASPERHPLWFYLGWWLVFIFGICWLHDHVLTEAHDEAKEWWLLNAQESISRHGVKGLAVSEHAAVEPLAPHLLASREKTTTMIGTFGSDAPKYIAGAFIWLFILWQAFSVVWFGLVALVGLVLLAYGAVKISETVSEHFDRKQAANMSLQQEERKFLRERDDLRDENHLLFLFRDAIYSGTEGVFESLKKPWKRYRLATFAANLRLLGFNRMLGMEFDLTKVIAGGALVYYCYHGQISAGTVVFLFMLLPKAAEPISMYQNLQKLMLEAQFFVNWYETVVKREPLTLREEMKCLRVETAQILDTLHARLRAKLLMA